MSTPESVTLSDFDAPVRALTVEDLLYASQSGHDVALPVQYVQDLFSTFMVTSAALAAQTGAALVGYNGGTVADALASLLAATGGGGGVMSASDNLIGASVGVLIANQSLLKAITPQALTFPAGFAGSFAYCTDAPTADAVCPVNVTSNGVTTQIGTVTFAANYFVGTFSLTSDYTTTAGDIVEILAPATADDTFSGPCFGIAASVVVFDGLVGKKTADYTLVATDRNGLIVMNATAATNVNLPSPTGTTGNFPNGWRSKCFNISAQSATLTVPTGVNLNGILNGTLVLTNLQSAEVWTDGVDWYTPQG